VYLIPRAIYKDPFRRGDNILVMCDAYEPPKVKEDGSVGEPVPIPTNTRFACAAVMAKTAAEVCPPTPLEPAEADSSHQRARSSRNLSIH
jgi:hypothetical protein